MQYTQRDLLAADMLALIFVGIGIALVAFGVIGLSTGEPRGTKADVQIVSAESAEKPLATKDIKPPEPANAASSGLVPLVIGFVCLCLGVAVNLKVRQLKRTGGKEPSDYEGVPTS